MFVLSFFKNYYIMLSPTYRENHRSDCSNAKRCCCEKRYDFFTTGILELDLVDLITLQQKEIISTLIRIPKVVKK